jgi:hypothetical protein
MGRLPTWFFSDKWAASPQLLELFVEAYQRYRAPKARSGAHCRFVRQILKRPKARDFFRPPFLDRGLLNELVSR